MGRAAFVIALYLAATASAFGYGSIVAGNNGSSVEFLASSNQPTAQDAEAVALQDCRSQGLQECVVRQTFRNVCLAVGLNGGDLTHFGEGPTPFQAQQNMIASCVTGQVVCTWTMTACDTTPAPEPAPAAATTPEQPAQTSENSAPSIGGAMAGLAYFLAWLERYWQVWITLAIFTAAALFIAVLRLCVSIVSTAPSDVLKERALISAWIVVPAAMMLADFNLVWVIGFFSYLVLLALLAWTSAFGALIIGGRFRRLVSKSWEAPAPLSLPLAGFAFGSVATLPLSLYWFYGGRLTFWSCGSQPYPFFSLCRVQQLEGIYFTAVLLLLIALCGAVLPPNSNLVIAHHRFGSFIRKCFAALRPKRRAAAETAEEQLSKTGALVPAAAYPVPALYSGTMLEAMRLLLKRSQRSSVFGKIIFVLDARMELTRDEYDLLRKYRLGADVIYESSSRQRRKEATQAHLEMTKRGPSLSDTAGAQLMGVAKSLFWFGRASISATAASLSLRITIHGLLSGVHVECKSMNELLQAESAIREAAEGLRAYLDIAATFDGREEIVEFQ